jgi:hypothetical protein
MMVAGSHAMATAPASQVGEESNDHTSKVDFVGQNSRASEVDSAGQKASALLDEVYQSNFKYHAWTWPHRRREETGAGLAVHHPMTSAST